MTFLGKDEMRSKINHFGETGSPFIFLIDASAEKGFVCIPGEAQQFGISFIFRGIGNALPEKTSTSTPSFSRNPIAFELYEKAFNKVMHHLNRGDTYLLNLTFPTPLTSSFSMEEIFQNANAAYKLLVKDQFALFSPECFIRITDGKISSFPMKGTIDATIPNAEEIILASDKEFFEHNTIVDLIRNDLSMVSENVTVKRFRYIEKIRTNHRDLLQVSSEISGDLPEDYPAKLGDILFKLLPAGSVTGAPKEKTVEIIREVELDDRGFYTGICGIFDGINLDSAVMIRFIEKSPTGLIFRSGGGITALSDARDEYQELTDKIYVPII